MLNRFVALCAFMLVATAAHATDRTITFTDMVARPSINDVGVAYFTVTSAANEAITGISSDCCKAVELHRSEKINGIMSMRHIRELTLKKEKPLAAQQDGPGGEHLMLIGLAQPLVEGDAVSITFHFKKAPSQRVTFPVIAQKSADATHKHDHH